MGRDGRNELNLNHTLMLLPRKMLTLNLLRYPSNLGGAELSEAVGWPSLGECYKHLLDCCGWQHGPDSKGNLRWSCFPHSLRWGAECRISQPGAVLSPTAKGTLLRCSAQIQPSITALETCKSMRGKEERYRCKHPEGQCSIKREQM